MSTESKSQAKKSLLASSAKMAGATSISRVLGLVREQVIAFYFGATGSTDAFFVAYRIPNLLRDLFAEGAFSSAFVPEFTEEKQKSLESANNLLWKLFFSLLITTGFISLLTFIFAEEVVGVFAPKFKEMPEVFDLTVQLVRIMSPFLLAVSLAALFMGALNSLKVFFLPALAPATFNISMILSMVFGIGFLRDQGMPGVYALGVGVLIGGVVQGLFQLPKLFKLGFRFQIHNPFSVFQDSRVNKVFKKLGPGLLGFAATQINLIVTTILASGAGIGAVSWLSYGFRIFQLPVGVLGVSVAGSNLVHFSEAWKLGHKKEAIEVLRSSISIIFLVLIPAALIGIFLSNLTMEILFERGEFDALDSKNSALALRYYLYGLPFYGLYKLFVPVFYTLDEQRKPVTISAFCVGFNIVFCLLTVDQYGFQVLALGTTISMILNSILQFYFLKNSLGFSLEIIFNLRNLKIFLSGGICLVSGFLFNYLGISQPEKTLLAQIPVLLLQFIFLAGTYGSALLLLGERKTLGKLVRKFRR